MFIDKFEHYVVLLFFGYFIFYLLNSFVTDNSPQPDPLWYRLLKNIVSGVENVGRISSIVVGSVVIVGGTYFYLTGGFDFLIELNKSIQTLNRNYITMQETTQGLTSTLQEVLQTVPPVEELCLSGFAARYRFSFGLFMGLGVFSVVQAASDSSVTTVAYQHLVECQELTNLAHQVYSQNVIYQKLILESSFFHQLAPHLQENIRLQLEASVVASSDLHQAALLKQELARQQYELFQRLAVLNSSQKTILSFFDRLFK